MSMFKVRKRLNTVLVGLMVFITAPVLASEDYGNPFTEDGFVNQDWQVVCDNTLTCRIAGYMDQRDIDRPASIMFVVKPMQKISTGYIKLASNSNDNNALEELLPTNQATLWLNNKNYGVIDSNSVLNSDQLNALLERARQNLMIEIKVGNKTWEISDRGMASVLLKLDEVQGRIGTSLALVSKNNPNKQAPKALKPVPIMHRPTLSKIPLKTDKKNYFEKNILNWIYTSQSSTRTETIKKDCYLIDPSQSEKKFMDARHSSVDDWSFISLDADHTLASHVCWIGMPDSGYGYWVINNNNPTKPQRVTLSASDYQEDMIWMSRDTRADCGLHKSWAWNGQAFVKASQSTTGLCRGFLYGAWDLPTYITQSVNDNGEVIDTPLRYHYYH